MVAVRRFSTTSRLLAFAGVFRSATARTHTSARESRLLSGHKP